MSPKDNVPQSHRRAKFRDDGIRLINGNQTNMVIAVGIEHNLRGTALLEWIEFEAGVNVTKLEDIRDDQLSGIMRKLREA